MDFKNKCFSNRNINSLLKTQYIIRAGALFLLSAISINAIAAGGFGLGSTRLVYPSDSQQITLSVQNGGANTSYLIQSWIDDNQSSKKVRILWLRLLYLCYQREKKPHWG